MCPSRAMLPAVCWRRGLKRTGPQLDTEKLVEALETLRDFDMGLGTPG